MPTKFAAHLTPGDRIHLHDHEQTVTRTETWTGPTIAVYTDYTDDDPWLLKPAEKITTQPADA